MSPTMEQLLFLQEDLSSRMIRGRSNYKQTPIDRRTKELAQSKLEALEKSWCQFCDTHAELCKTADPKLLRASLYIMNTLYDTTEELYIDFKITLMKYLPVERSTELQSQPLGKSGANSTSSFAKLPKIVIPKFTGDYNEWITFRDLFKSLVHDSDMDKAVKMQYLKGLLGGEAEQLVRNMSISSANYEQCWATLIERYNNTRYLCNNILKRLFSQRSSSSESAFFLKEVLDNTTECIGALANLGVDVSTWDLIIIYMTSLKLDPESRKQWELQSANCDQDELPKFKAFQKFLTKRFRAFEFMDAESSSDRSKVSPKPFQVAEVTKTSVICKYCKDQHKLVHCKSFENEEVSARRMFVEKQRLCFNCLGEGHSANQCRCQISCHVCQRRHHTFLHSDRDISSKLAACSDSTEETEPGEEVPVVNFTSGGVASNKQVLVATALVKAETENGGTRVVRALLDQGAQASFVTEAAVQHLGLKKTPVKLFMSGVGGVHKVAITATVNLSILSMRKGFQNSKLTLKVYVLKSITTSLPSKRIMLSNWVSSLPLADPQYNKPSKIDLLLGAEVVGQIMREGIQKQGSLLAQNTTLGWILSGVAGSNSNKQAMNLIAMHQVCFGEQNQLDKQCEQEADVKTEVDSKQGDRSKLKTDDVRVVAYRKSVNRLNRRKKRKKNIEQSFLITQVLTKTVEECYKKYQRNQSRKNDKPREKWEWNIYKLKGSFKSNA